jgi:hypothetical protein
MGAQSWMKEILNEKLQLFPEGSFKLCVFPGLLSERTPEGTAELNLH